MNMPLLELHKVSKSYGPDGGKNAAVLDRISLTLDPGEALGLTGPSGSGKTTIARLALGIETPNSGRVLFQGHPVTDSRGDVSRHYYSRVQIIWQDPQGFLNPYLSVLTSIMERSFTWSGTPQTRKAERGPVPAGGHRKGFVHIPGTADLRRSPCQPGSAPAGKNHPPVGPDAKRTAPGPAVHIS